MNLFKINHQLFPIKLNSLNFQTPLGNLLFNCNICDKSLMIMQPSTVECFQTTNIASSWVTNDYTVEFLRLNFMPKLPLGVKVDQCIFAVWRIKSLAKIISFNFSCCLENNLIGSPESGEGLVAQSFENEGYKLFMGTEDEEYLKQRAKSRYWLPSHFKAKIDVDQISYLSNGIKITLPELSENEELQIHFIISFSSKQNSDISLWYAVDQSAVPILEQAGIM